MSPDNLDASSILQFREGSNDARIQQEGYRRVVEELQGQGVEPLVVRGQYSQAELETGLVTPSGITITETDGQFRLSTEPLPEPRELGATSIRAYYSQLSSEVEKTGAQVINTERVRGLDRKTEAYKLISQHQPLTQHVNPAELGEQLSATRTDKVVLKPVKAAGGRGLVIVSKADLVNPDKFSLRNTDEGLLLEDVAGQVNVNLTSGEGYLLQEMIDTTRPFPPGIEIFPVCQQEYEAKRNFPKEVRLMVYWDKSRADQQTVIPYARVFTPLVGGPTRTQDTHDDQWLLLDIHKPLPPDLEQISKDVITKILEYGSVNYLHGAIDVAWDGNRWFVMELNMWFPAPPSYKLARSVGAEDLADVHRREMARLLANSAKDAAAHHTSGSTTTPERPARSD